MHSTIAAISTAQGIGGIGIVRISGSKAFDIAEAIFKGKKSFRDKKTHTVSYGKIIDPFTNLVVDEVLITKLKAPNTFTREDMVEVNCHGGIVVLKKVLELILKHGAVMAEPGEFTKRAFLNGRIDLTQAEAVIDLINAKTDESSKAAINMLEGKLAKKISAARKELIGLIAHIEAAIDFPEHDIEQLTSEKVYQELTRLKEKLFKILKSFDQGKIIRDGINAVIIGRANVGKSSLLNEISGTNKAIVTDIPGTTRDIIEEYVNIAGIPVKITDTAGIRHTDDPVEKIGVEIAKKALENADVVIVIIDSSQGLLDEDIEILNNIKNKNIIVLLNKIDIADIDTVNATENRLKNYKTIQTSALNGIGIDALNEAIKEMFFEGSINTDNEALLTNIRHKDLLDKSVASIEDALSAHEGGMPLDCISIDIKNAAQHLGEITGESVAEDVVREIFNKFCIGK